MIVATAGHVDHGKTSLVKQLTGVDTDRLEDDGLMPQTLEHLQVLTMLGVKQIVVVITKIDAVDRGPIDALRSSALALLPQSRIFEVSNKGKKSASGIDALQEYLDNQAKVLKPRNAQGLFRMSIDRTFRPHLLRR